MIESSKAETQKRIRKSRKSAASVFVVMEPAEARVFMSATAHDGIVNALDFNAVVSNFRSHHSAHPGSGAQSVVNALDFNALVANFPKH